MTNTDTQKTPIPRNLMESDAIALLRKGIFDDVANDEKLSIYPKQQQHLIRMGALRALALLGTDYVVMTYEDFKPYQDALESKM